MVLNLCLETHENFWKFPSKLLIAIVTEIQSTASNRKVFSVVLSRVPQVISREVPVLQPLLASAHAHPGAFSLKVAVRVLRYCKHSFCFTLYRVLWEGLWVTNVILPFLTAIICYNVKAIFFLTSNLALSFLKNFDLLAYGAMLHRPV